jgi:hypothetical protein
MIDGSGESRNSAGFALQEPMNIEFTIFPLCIAAIGGRFTVAGGHRVAPFGDAWTIDVGTVSCFTTEILYAFAGRSASK